MNHPESLDKLRRQFRQLYEIAKEKQLIAKTRESKVRKQRGVAQFKKLDDIQKMDIRQFFEDFDDQFQTFDEESER